jgi:hypothetical protein
LDAQSCSRLFGRNTSTEEGFPPTRIGGVADEEAVGNGGRRRIDDQLWRGVSPKTSGNAAARNHGPGDEFRGSMVRATSNLGQRVPGRAFRTDRPDTQHVEEDGTGNGQRRRPAGIARRSVRQIRFNKREGRATGTFVLRRTIHGSLAPAWTSRGNPRDKVASPTVAIVIGSAQPETRNAVTVRERPLPARTCQPCSRMSALCHRVLACSHEPGRRRSLQVVRLAASR